jgi:transcription initiation factor TFIID subunit 11
VPEYQLDHRKDKTTYKTVPPAVFLYSECVIGAIGLSAREVMEDWGETGPIRPEHLREAQRRYKKEELQRGQGVQIPSGYKRRMFNR